MLQLSIKGKEIWDDFKLEFIYTDDEILELEHSLVSISKWEAKWCKPFFSKKERTYEETIDYIKQMTLNNPDNDIYKRLSYENLKEIEEYINSPCTATYIYENKENSPSRETVTSELIYYWMIIFNIPAEYQYWHLNRLMMLIRVCEIKSKKPKTMGKGALMRRNSALNAARRKKYNTRG